MSDSFKTIVGDARAEMKVQGSRFIATAHHTATKAEIEKFIHAVKKEFFDATHNCYAYRLGTLGDQFRFNDNGEPSGSAGRLILAAIDHEDLTDVVVVVTRYFGGTKLGIAGLSRAYGRVAETVLTKAGQTTKFMLETIVVTFPHAHIGNVMKAVSTHEAKIVDTFYDEEIHLTVEIRASKVGAFKASLIDLTSGNVALKSLPK